jgi:hypothetical protein
MMIQYQGRKSKHNFFLANIGVDEVILGYPFFEALLPDVDWRQGKVSSNISLEMEDADCWKLTCRQQTKWKHKVPLWIRALPDWEDRGVGGVVAPPRPRGLVRLPVVVGSIPPRGGS